ncbi:hypothetical protein M0R72_02600 [Candidatus Pacearchaeota archaeon]|jgi:hypothetical protein|nr:hypothetical protein [Candidatus Pacearchaeota archaeon]
MKISDLADLVAVRNHISIVMNDKSVCSKDDVRPLNEARVKLDKKFIAALRDADVEGLFSQPVIAPQRIKSSDIVFLQSVENVTQDLYSPKGVWEEADTSLDHHDDTEQSVAPETEPVEATEDSEAAELALIAERVRAQKEQLKKEGRSNKRKPKDGTTK